MTTTMKIIKNRVLLLKSNEQSGEYEKLFNESGYSVQQVSAIDFRFVQDDCLIKALNDHQSYSGLILTSPRSVTAIENTGLAENPQILEAWRQKTVFVVGQKSYQLAKEKLGFESIGAECSNGTRLADFIVKTVAKAGHDSSYVKPLLFPCGNLAQDTLPNVLAVNEVPFESIIAYETVENPQFQTELVAFTKNGQEFAEFCVFFSPSAVQFSLPFLRTFCERVFPQLILIAFGPSTKKALQEHKANVHGTSEQPNAKSLLTLIKTLQNK